MPASDKYEDLYQKIQNSIVIVLQPLYYINMFV